MLATVLVCDAAGLIWFAATAMAYRKWGSIGLLGIPIGIVVLLAAWAGLAALACAEGNGCL